MLYYKGHTILTEVSLDSNLKLEGLAGKVCPKIYMRFSCVHPLLLGLPFGLLNKSNSVPSC